MNQPDQQKRFVSPLHKLDELALLRRAKRGSKQALEAIYNQFHRYTVQLCHRFSRGWMYGDDGPDIISEATRAMMIAVQSFDPTRDVRFATWLRFMVRRYVLDYVERRNRLGGPNSGGTVSLSVGPGETPTRGEAHGELAPRVEASYEAGLVANESPDVILARKDTLERVYAVVRSWPANDAALFLSRIEKGTRFDDLTAFLPPGSPRGRRAASVRFRRLRQQLLEELQ